MSTKNTSYKLLIAALLALFLLGKGSSLLHSYSHDQDHSHKIAVCSICSFANFSASAAATPDLKFVITAFLLLIFLREFDRVKLSYLLSSRCCRAPPQFLRK